MLQYSNLKQVYGYVIDSSTFLKSNSLFLLLIIFSQNVKEMPYLWLLADSQTSNFLSK